MSPHEVEHRFSKNDEGWVTGGSSWGTGIGIEWQSGPLSDERNGATVEDVILTARARLEAFEEVPLSSCLENRQAIEHLTGALAALRRREIDRGVRGVKGKYES